ncbi:helix-turn-helix domain-containing protein [Ralstonia sp. ASV6]|uniref:helix-turn-helix domain-containing protein n=1 Tax=Ralstonia sp. ASV6 TaxID=2795124 RepID=UPI0018ED17B3|nr:helix-turn-helix transcriptional regulator [Ralstonia sp. ASV6]
MAALIAMGEDPTANRVDAVHARVASNPLSEGDRAAGIRDAIERAGCELDALGAVSAPSSTVAGVARGDAADAVGLDTVGQRIAYARKQAKLSQKAIADRLGITQGAVSQWEQELTVPSLEQVGPLAKLVGASIDWLVLGSKEPPVLAPAPSAAVPGVGERGLSSLQQAALDALKQAFLHRLISNDRCLALLNDWQTMVNGVDDPGPRP